MTASLETLVVAAYMFADQAAIPRRGPAGKITDAELVALAVAQAAIGVPSDRQFLGLVGELLPGWFPHLPEQFQYNRRLRRLASTLAVVQLNVCELIAVGGLRIADGTLVGVANYPGCAARSEFAGTAAYGYCPGEAWALRTRPKRIRAAYTRPHSVRHLLCALDVADDLFSGELSERKTRVEFLASCTQVRSRYPSETRLTFTLDNFSVHKGDEIRAWAEANNRCLMIHWIHHSRRYPFSVKE